MLHTTCLGWAVLHSGNESRGLPLNRRERGASALGGPGMGEGGLWVEDYSKCKYAEGKFTYLRGAGGGGCVGACKKNSRLSIFQ